MVTTSTSVTTITLVSAVPGNDVTVEVTVRVLRVAEPDRAGVACLRLEVSTLEW